MRDTPLNYRDFLLTSPQGPFPLVTDFREDGKHTAECTCLPGHMQSAATIVDCRHIDKSIVVQDWACHGCWSTWIRKSGSKENLFDCIKNTPGMGKNALRSETAKSGRFKDHPNKNHLQAMLVAAKDNGEISMAAPKKGCFTFTHWLQMHNVTNATRRKGKKTDFIP